MKRLSQIFWALLGLPIVAFLVVLVAVCIVSFYLLYGVCWILEKIFKYRVFDRILDEFLNVDISVEREKYYYVDKSE
tara:strand:- start:1613 stop:1843 length:231 start_codon:yes stop_codon:yes gene_type:complete